MSKTSAVDTAVRPFRFKAPRWYQYYFATERGRLCYGRNTEGC